MRNNNNFSCSESKIRADGDQKLIIFLDWPYVCVCSSIVVNECGREMSEQKDQHNVNEELWRAVDKENVDAVLHLLENRGDPNYRSTFDDDGKLLEIKVGLQYVVLLDEFCKCVLLFC